MFAIYWSGGASPFAFWNGGTYANGRIQMNPILILFGVVSSVQFIASVLYHLLCLLLAPWGFLDLPEAKLKARQEAAEQWICFFVVGAAAYVFYHYCRKAFEEAGWRGMLNFALFGQARNEDPNNNQAGAAGGAAAAGVGPGGQGAAAARPGQRRQRHTVDSVAEALHALPTELHATKEDVSKMGIHDLKELLHRRGVDCTGIVDKCDLVARVGQMLEEQGGSSATSCSICCEDYEPGDAVRVLRCKHRFHIECIDKWLLSATDFSRPPACPLCNAELIQS